jgi:hypothetical protein
VIKLHVSWSAWFGAGHGKFVHVQQPASAKLCLLDPKQAHCGRHVRDRAAGHQLSFAPHVHPVTGDNSVRSVTIPLDQIRLRLVSSGQR